MAADQEGDRAPFELCDAFQFIEQIPVPSKSSRTGLRVLTNLNRHSGPSGQTVSTL